MNQVLTQSEVDALLNAVAEGSVDSNPAGGAPSAGAPAGGGDPTGGGFGDGALQDAEITPYDLTNQDRVIRGRMPTLDIIYERFIRLYRMSLSNSLR
jgi:flagellar motor switch protein FliM